MNHFCAREIKFPYANWKYLPTVPMLDIKLYKTPNSKRHIFLLQEYQSLDFIILSHNRSTVAWTLQPPLFRCDDRYAAHQRCKYYQKCIELKVNIRIISL